MKEKQITGSIVAIVTPFKNGKVDYVTLRKLVKWHIKMGTSGIVFVGTTGESATLNYDEHMKVIREGVRMVDGKILAIGGTGANSTDETILMTRQAAKDGVDAVLLVVPYYNKPSQEGLYRHYKAVAKKVNVPIILYNVPGRTALNMEPATIASLAHIDNIVAIKEASGNTRQVSDIIRLCGDKITVLSGDDFTTYASYCLGAKGAISVTANITPKLSANMWSTYESGDIQMARNIHFNLEPLNAAMFLETNPVPVKTSLAMMGMIQEEFRLPLCEMSPANKEKLRTVLSQYKLIE